MITNRHETSFPFFPTLSSVEYLDAENLKLAEQYVMLRWEDSKKLIAEMDWGSTMQGVLGCKMYGHSILHDVCGMLHAWKHRGKYEMLVKGDDDPIPGLDLVQVLAFLLARHW